MHACEAKWLRCCMSLCPEPSGTVCISVLFGTCGLGMLNQNGVQEFVVSLGTSIVPNQ